MIQVAAALIENKQGQLLIARRREGKSQAGLWEFPGGKIEAGESGEECLRRELMEEMNIEIEPYEYLGVNDHWYGEVHIRLLAWKAKYKAGEVILVDHDEYRWVEKGELNSFDFAEADKVFVRMVGAR
ncbi:(deoxy)nucleoside triphosphate pyrophosphohydrolase [Paenibacillus lentus]|uniref:8-oxo-dGTP diphosphatase n=1 Tax=Paenibacillus lentus TaxID=1338368 RepID=A0A3S8RZU3_9BACL|nr:(deoxy)nucleoside triphosphate pyrophosphohydrolase [Paenibacillus lentus]AZK48470.1 (deoxy)nucleoside triphosphate pyrophosphohydrolase [Paenibacillus lentus]